MATTYWNFASDKPTGDMTLKGDWDVTKVTIRVYDDTNFLGSRYRAKGTYNDLAGMPYNIGGFSSNENDYELLWYRLNQVNTPKTWASGQWAQANIMNAQSYALGADYGMEVGDMYSIGCDNNTSRYRNGIARATGVGFTSTPWIQMRTSNAPNPWLQNLSDSSWQEDWKVCNEGALALASWEIFLTVWVPAGTYTPDNAQRIWRIHPNRRRDIEVDYGTTIQQLINSGKLPTGWKKNVGSVSSPSNWVVNNGAYAGKKLSEVPSNTQITGYWDIMVRY